MLSIRGITLFKQPISCLSILNLEQQKCGLKMHKSEPPPKMTIPTKSKLPVLPKIPAEFTNFYGKVPKGMTTYIPCPSTSPKTVCAGRNFLVRTKNRIALFRLKKIVNKN